jgi:hypothetical protein
MTERNSFLTNLADLLATAQIHDACPDLMHWQDVRRDWINVSIDLGKGHTVIDMLRDDDVIENLNEMVSHFVRNDPRGMFEPVKIDRDWVLKVLGRLKNEDAYCPASKCD